MDKTIQEQLDYLAFTDVLGHFNEILENTEAYYANHTDPFPDQGPMFSFSVHHIERLKKALRHLRPDIKLPSEISGSDTSAEEIRIQIDLMSPIPTKEK
tara:strand:- start:413 stop:709 length:297 start_codon:yes stop_codon:yes gene_type:complete